MCQSPYAAYRYRCEPFSAWSHHLHLRRCAIISVHLHLSIMCPCIHARYCSTSHLGYLVDCLRNNGTVNYLRLEDLLSLSSDPTFLPYYYRTIPTTCTTYCFPSISPQPRSLLPFLPHSRSLHTRIEKIK